MSSQAQKNYSQSTGIAHGILRPTTLKEAVQIHNDGLSSWQYSGAEFFDRFYMATEPEDRAAMIADEPPMPYRWQTDQAAPNMHVYIAGIAEWLANEAGIEAPKWTQNADRFRATPIYTFDTDEPDEEEIRFCRERALPELAKRNYFVNTRLHERSYRWIMGFDPAHTERRRKIKADATKKDLRAIRLIEPMFDEGHGFTPDEIALRNRMAAECLNTPGATLESVLEKNGVTAESLGLDLSPMRPANQQALPNTPQRKPGS